jgi:putative membrane-bound dehydrogenase-like protein
MRFLLPALLLVCGTALLAQKGTIPHAQDKEPGPALSPAEALKKMKVPEGFTVELVAAEPDLVNPVAMCFDEKGRVWVTESVEYPRRSAGPGKDRVKVLEIGPDGKASKVTTFAEGLNIPSGIAVGHGGVWVANAPDILFYKVGKDGKAEGKPEVVVTGFGRTDTHELPNSLTWGPDGWLYGWNGVFNHSHVKHRGKEYRFTCAIFRIHPKTRDFEVWCEGTSNPWGIAINDEGHFFASACVIDHLWHLTETGYYIRQGGPYPPHTWPMGSIVKHRHQKAAYCGIHWFDSDAYPEKYRGKLYMGNIHGGCINVDSIKRDGSTYAGSPEPDFLTANDAWFMPVSQKTGPDGCLYILDWYDRYHCYQDANRDPRGIDRLNGRLYRVRYKETPRAKPFDLAKEADADLLQRLGDANVYIRDTAQRLLTERVAAENGRLETALEKLVLDDRQPRKARLHALWALFGGSGKLDAAFQAKLLAHDDAAFRAFGIRAAGNMRMVADAVRDRVARLASDPSRDVQLQVAIAARKIDGLALLPVLARVLASCGDDRLIPHIVWQNLHPLLEAQGEAFLAAVVKEGVQGGVGAVLPRVAERLLAARRPDARALAALLDAAKGDVGLARRVLAALSARVGEVGDTTGLRKALAPRLLKEMEGRGPLRFESALLLAAFRDEAGLGSLRAVLKDGGGEERGRALDMLASLRDASVLESAPALLGPMQPTELRARAIAALGRLEDEKVAVLLLGEYAGLPGELQARAIEALALRDSWGKALLRAVADKKVPPGAINVNQARRLLASKDKELVALVTKHWGTVRTERSPEREKVVAEIKSLLSRTRGDPKKGIAVYKNLCGQCHKIHGEGVEVGPDITSNGRASFDQLLSNVFDPSLVIGPGYHATTVIDVRGRSVTGLLVEDGEKRVVLKVQGGKLETIPRDAIEKMETSKLSMMPEGVEKQLKPGELADLFAFLCLDKHPDDKNARYIPGTPKGLTGGK